MWIEPDDGDEIRNYPNRKRTGGLKDTVEAYNEYENTGTGFSFTDYNAHDMLRVIKYAESVFKNNKKAWNEMMVRDMNKDFFMGCIRSEI